MLLNVNPDILAAHTVDTMMELLYPDLVIYAPLNAQTGPSAWYSNAFHPLPSHDLYTFEPGVSFFQLYPALQANFKISVRLGVLTTTVLVPKAM